MPHAAAWGGLLEELELQRACLDMMNNAWVSDYRSRGGLIFCGRGCRACCNLAVNCTLTEAVALAATLGDEQAHAVSAHATTLRARSEAVTSLKDYLHMHRREMGACPLLDAEGACSVYDLRPLSCRSLLSTRESSWCAVDFGELTSDEKQAYSESLDLAAMAFPMHYAAFPQETGQELEERALTLMRKTFGLSVYGNMPVLVHLVRTCGLADAVVEGAVAVHTVITEAGCGNSYMVEVQPAG